MSPSSSASASRGVSRALEARVQSLASLMASLRPITAPPSIGGLFSSPLQSQIQDVQSLATEAAIHVVVVEVLGGNKILAKVNNVMVEAELSPEHQAKLKNNPEALQVGTRLSLTGETRVRVVAADPATRVVLSADAQHAAQNMVNAGGNPPLGRPHIFVAGSMGALVEDYIGRPLNAAEPETLEPKTGANTWAALPPTNRQSKLQHPIAPILASNLQTATHQQLPLAKVISTLLAQFLPKNAPLSKIDSPPLATQFMAALAELTTLRNKPEALVHWRKLQQAVQSSGLFLEGNLAQPDDPQPFQKDLKTVFLTLQALSKQSNFDAEITDFLQKNAGNDGALAQPQMIRRLIEGALARINLLQLASLPDHAEARITDQRDEPLHFALSLPIATQGEDDPATALLGLVIQYQPPTPHKPRLSEEQEKSHPPRQQELEYFPWHIRLSLDLPETGIVQADLRMNEQTLAATLWGERKEIVAQMQEALPLLHSALQKTVFEVSSLEVKLGSPIQAEANTPRVSVLNKKF